MGNSTMIASTRTTELQRVRRGHRSSGQGRRLRTVLCIAFTAVAMLLSACGSSDEDPVSGANGASSFDATAAEAIVKKAVEGDTSILATVPLKEKPEPGKTIVWLRCSVAECKLTEDTMAIAVKAVGWNLKSVSYNSADPATLVAAFKQALQYHPVAVALDGIPQAAWSSVLPEYRAAGVSIIASLMGEVKLDDVVIADLWNNDDLEIDGKNFANWLALDSHGKGNAVVLNVPDFPILAKWTDSFVRNLKDVCPDCKTTVVDATIAQMAEPSTANGLMVSSLQRDPSAKYAITSYGPFNPGLPAALSGAGISGVKIGGALGSIENMSQIAQGTEAAFTGQHQDYFAWLIVDTALRHAEGMQITSGGGGMPHQLITKENVGEPTANMKVPVNFQAQFEKLWKVGS